MILSGALPKAQTIGMQITCVTMNRKVIHLDELEFPLPKDIFCLVGSRGDFQMSSMYFRYFVIVFPWERNDPLFAQT